MSLQQETKKKNMLNLLEQTLGNVSASCKALGITRKTHYNWLQSDEEYKELDSDIKESVVDFAESKLVENIKKGKETSLIFFLKTQGKERGYVERTEHSFDKEINISFED